MKNKKTIDWKQIDEFCDVNPKPSVLSVTKEEWRKALLGIRETISESELDETSGVDRFTTQTAWHLIWFGAFQFCKGLIKERIDSGKMDHDNYPTH